ncbi:MULTISPECIES: iron-sulfur cluster assembly scaffold protein [Rhizobium/Agrobacterium group]|jgi:SUF system NifU family Fe-S assembly protein|uniref:Iron-sulfur cluster assembly scaffold protein n=1 Tax=Rhizobium rhizogenes TaxID=359 RepID=A0AA92C5I4_RHIRH|nr:MULTISPECIES: iron-sulfur cluster assembly scaffold protein [Rhizobium/Agrobacterium group]KQR33182.1 nitrogen fixation protein NifU [Rhizobium sp. Leaf155]MQB20825.1 iron-sulfur cluster assembly scaffold protein [Agrobacterium tumefaciens]PVE74001.1 iron-sulfur cluster assembly scaffold protein [Sphingomonas sp. TPD3009]PVE56368.1 iron-sulfur cluster assembly scaffold protein [Rhizobium rhizogenes]PVE64863.1 iron-sulfur cluster assembly scaffold protein [Agrobacterium tumefaciens]
MDDIYNNRILEFAGNIPLAGGMADADAQAEKHSKLCGSKVKVYIKMDGDQVCDFSHEVRACALGQASSSIMAHHVVGASRAEIRKARQDMIDMLTANGEGPEGRFEDMRVLKPVKDYKARHASTLLTFEAVCDCLDQLEAKQPLSAAS